MLYLERIPAPPLDRFVHKLWYARAPQVAAGRERVLPNGCVQVILNLAREFILDLPKDKPEERVSPALVVGSRSIFEIVDTSDMADLIGVAFKPGGFAAFVPDSVDRYSNTSVPLEAVWGTRANSLRDGLREAVNPCERFLCLERFLLDRFRTVEAGLNLLRHETVEFALNRFTREPSLSTVKAAARDTGWSDRRFTQIFREQVGHSPKVWCRIQRFQRAVRLLHSGADVRWSELALDCGFYDQSHFANEFRAFSGVDATTYSAKRTQWANHIRVQ